MYCVFGADILGERCDRERRLRRTTSRAPAPALNDATRGRGHVLVHKDFIIDNNFVSLPLFVSCRRPRIVQGGGR